ncbi:MAG: glycosyltransferase family 2 protein [Pseudonocardiaceae bacterium]
MSIQSTDAVPGPVPTMPLSPNDEAIVDVRSLGDDIPVPRVKDVLRNGAALTVGTNGNVAVHKAGMVSLVIPARNEAANIAWVLEQVPPCVDEIVLVDGNSTDATLVTARSSRPDLRVVTQQHTGKGDALRAGFLAASGDVIVMIDADGSMSPQEIPHFLHFLSNGYDFVKGSRFVGGGGSLDITRTRRLGNRALLQLVNTLYDAHLTDLCYGFCAFHRRYLAFLDLTTPGFEIETQMTISALRAGLRIAEVPSLELPRRHGQSNLRTFRDGTRVLRTVLREHRSGVSGHAVQTVRQLVHRSSGAASDQSPRNVRP